MKRILVTIVVMLLFGSVIEMNAMTAKQKAEAAKKAEEGGVTASSAVTKKLIYHHKNLHLEKNKNQHQKL